MAKSETRKRRFGRWWLDLLMVLAVVVGVRLWQAPSVDEADLPEVQGATLAGQEVHVGPGEGPTVLHFWASWCGVCEAEAPNIAALSREAHVVTVASRSGSDARVQAYLEREGLSDLHVLNDAAGVLARRFGVRAYPTTFVFDKDGELVTTEVGYATLWGLRARVWWAGL